MKLCPNCGNQVNAGALGCPECGARWDEDGAFLGVPEGTPAFVPVVPPRRVGDMTPDQLGALVFRKAFWGAVLALVAAGGTFWVLGIALAGCVSGGID